MYKEVRMLILNTYMASDTRPKFSIYMTAGITSRFTTFAVRYLHNSELRKLCPSYLSNWELMQRVSAKEFVKISKYEVI